MDGRSRSIDPKTKPFSNSSRASPIRLSNKRRSSPTPNPAVALGRRVQSRSNAPYPMPDTANPPFKPTYHDPVSPDKPLPEIGSYVAIYVDPGSCYHGGRIGYLWQRAKVLKTFKSGGIYAEWRDKRSRWPRKTMVRATRWRPITALPPQPCTTSESSPSSSDSSSCSSVALPSEPGLS